jgi:colanic acid/amylovoran biosynthesis protein
VIAQLKKLNAGVLPIIKIKSVSHAKKVYGQLDLLVGMRMHSNILAAVQGVPFVAVSYEYKTEGIARDLQLGSVCIRCEEVNSNNLQKLVKKAFAQRGQLAKHMNDALLEIQSRDSLLWQRILQS